MCLPWHRYNRTHLSCKFFVSFHSLCPSHLNLLGFGAMINRYFKLELLSFITHDQPLPGLPRSMLSIWPWHLTLRICLFWVRILPNQFNQNYLSLLWLLLILVPLLLPSLVMTDNPGLSSVLFKLVRLSRLSLSPEISPWQLFDRQSHSVPCL